jgi:GT2 family glycosyltransferase
VAAKLAPSRRAEENIVPLPTSAHVAGLLSVVIVAHNGRELLRACLDSMSADEQAESWEVIVVDNASTDGAVAMLREDHPWVRVIESGGNVGFARAANIGVRESSGEYILLLNPDTVVPPGALSRCVEELQRRPSIGILGCKLVRLDGSLDHACKRSFPTPMSALAHMSRLSRLPVASRFAAYTASHIDDDDVALVDAVNGAFMLIRAAALDQVGLLDESYWMYGEDLDLCFRFWAAQWPVLYWPHQSVVHVKGGIAGRHRAWRTNLAFHRAMWIFFTRHQAASYPLPVRSAVWTAIWLKLGVSATHSAGARSAQRLRKLR